MRLKTLCLAFTAAGVAARAYSRSRRSLGTAGASAGIPASGAESPNTGERLQRAGLVSAAQGDDLFSSNAQRGPLPEATGLADFSRGA